MEKNRAQRLLAALEEYIETCPLVAKRFESPNTASGKMYAVEAPVPGISAYGESKALAIAETRKAMRERMHAELKKTEPFTLLLDEIAAARRLAASVPFDDVECGNEKGRTGNE